MSDEKQEMTWDSEKGTVTLVKGEDTKTFDLNKEDDRTSFMKLGQRGWYYDEEASKELGEARKIIQNWDKAIEQARESDDAAKQLIQKLESHIGRKLTFEEKKEIKEERILIDEEEDSKLNKIVADLRQQIADLQKKQAEQSKSFDERDTQAELDRLNKEADKLEEKYNGKNDTPKFERKEIFAFAWEKGIVDLEDAFKLKYFDKLTEAAKKQFMAELKEKSQDRKNMFVETGEGVSDADLKVKPIKPTSYHQREQIMTEALKKSGKSLFDE